MADLRKLEERKAPSRKHTTFPARPAKSRTRRAWSLLAHLAALLCAVSLVRAQSNDADYQVKAADLLSFAKFVDWPDKTFAGPRAPFMICVIGQDPFGSSLDKLLGQSVGDHPVEVDRYPTRSLSEAQHCQIAFISASEKPRFAKMIGSFHGKSVLLVGDTAGFASAGGMIEFQSEQDHVGFAINPDAAARAALTVSSKLLAIAQIVHDDPGKGKS